MKKVLCGVIAVVMMAAMVLSLSGCGGEADVDTVGDDVENGYNNSYDNTYEQNSVQEDNDNVGNEIEKELTSVYICRSFIATGCAQIENLDYDEYGYPCSGTYVCYCQGCGKDLGGGGFGTSGAFGSKHCFDCGKDQQYEIKANCEWIEVEE